MCHLNNEVVNGAFFKKIHCVNLNLKVRLTE